MRFALINSGIGLLAAAAELRRLRPDADLVLAMDPDGIPFDISVHGYGTVELAADRAKKKETEKV